jgi:hypothetical protein
MAPYASSPPRSTPAPASTYGTPSEYPNTFPNPYANPLSTPLPRPAMGSSAPSLPPLASVPPISSPPLGSPIGTNRTIPASAFRRTVSRSDTLDASGAGGPPVPVSPLSVRKKIPGEDISRGPSPGPTSPGAPPTYAPMDPEGGVGGGTERSLSPGVGDRKFSNRGIE